MFFILNLHLQALNDHKNTPDNRPDPADDDEDEDKLNGPDDDIGSVTTKSPSDNSTDTREEDVNNATDDGDDTLAGNLKASDTSNDVVRKTHVFIIIVNDLFFKKCIKKLKK